MAKDNIAQLEQLFKEQDFSIQSLELLVDKIAITHDDLRAQCRELIYTYQSKIAL